MEHTNLYQAFQSWVAYSYDTADRPYRQGTPEALRIEQEYLEQLCKGMNVGD